jgi:hypothetical protein
MEASWASGANAIGRRQSGPMWEAGDEHLIVSKPLQWGLLSAFAC